jgi:tetratricopeptide (TPR) repeat protein
MLGFYISLGALVIFVFIFARRYLLLEKGVSFKKAFLGKRNFFHHRDLPSGFEVTIDEMIPPLDKIDPKNVAKADLLLKKAEIFLGRGDLRAAEKLLIQVLALNPAEVEAYNRLGLIYLRQEKFNKAENIFRKLVLTSADEPAFFSNLGLAMYRQGKPEEAKGHYQKAIELDASRAGRYFSLGQVLRDLGEMEAALQHLRKAAEMEPRNLDYLMSLAEFYFENGFEPEAKTLTEEILFIDPKNEFAQKMKKRYQAE